jgi:hypothetical protein
MDYGPQWGNDGEVPIHLGCYYTTQQSNGNAWFGKPFDHGRRPAPLGWGLGSPSPDGAEMKRLAKNSKSQSPPTC